MVGRPNGIMHIYICVCVFIYLSIYLLFIIYIQLHYLYLLSTFISIIICGNITNDIQ
jgi:hypothetical protein